MGRPLLVSVDVLCTAVSETIMKVVMIVGKSHRPIGPSGTLEDWDVRFIDASHVVHARNIPALGR